ncbi:biliverdin-producing heme oxygenase [Azospirillum sp. SYSU D00513]|uniref:biliverdin-producing heme oxygenase n=1 Tax=Azospirillum sp. SYSU D00513 TaxID=2812561 RepID=UPI001A96B43D|nr:biliverdin-producing heme oxygenase [Azospirillum sp. SYSU D00513]
MGPVRQELREATQEIHDRLDRAALLRPLVEPTVTAEQYRTALVALHGFHAPAEARMGGQGERVALLRADLADLGLDPDRLPVADELPALEAEPARLAARYVLDGSAHGGRAMLPNITRALGFDAARGARFLASAGVDAQAQWKVLLARLEAEIATPEERALARGTAVGLFAALERWLARLERDPALYEGVPAR